MDREGAVKRGSFSGQIRAMFDDIAPTYDLLNRVNSLGLDQGWRADLVHHVAEERPQLILDLAAGTGDLSIMLSEKCPDATIVAGDLSEEMLQLGAKKVSQQGIDGIQFSIEDAMQLSFEDGTFDAVTCAFGVRNFESILRGYEEFFRVLKPGGMAAVLELCEPTNPLLKLGYDLYVKRIIPKVSKWVSGQEAAYDYLGESIRKVPQRRQMQRLMDMAGFINTYYKVYAPGVCGLYVGFKPKSQLIEQQRQRLYELNQGLR
ncbi:MAG: bifunctional demethylmenaquinone methyltransferase/2-methoxy-6-polyprenyl-1,4-benzoquinol methylase UbiE [Porphyromonas sp.]|nr:bifunctional demethylmenaquinone methyltransferase/2-methoxy-6-polyprenyl-1,4-benzoquinol methylase UbiE [Porphyromonas sp.]